MVVVLEGGGIGLRAEQLLDSLDNLKRVVIDACFIPAIIPLVVVENVRIAGHELLSAVIGSDLVRQ